MGRKRRVFQQEIKHEVMNEKLEMLNLYAIAKRFMIEDKPIPRIAIELNTTEAHVYSVLNKYGIGRLKTNVGIRKIERAYKEQQDRKRD